VSSVEVLSQTYRVADERQIELVRTDAGFDEGAFLTLVGNT
jgi:hypothetical protein